MSKDLNQVSIIGNLVRDPELKYTQSGKAVCKISIANNQDFGENKYCNFFDCTCWEKLAENCAKYLKKGSRVAIHGSLRQERWEHEGKNQNKIGIMISEIQFLNTKNDKENNENIPENPFRK